MKPLRKISLIATALAALFCTSCQSARETRIQQNPGVFQSLSTVEQQAVNHGRILNGMSTDAVYLSLGAPHNVISGSDNGKSAETWIYRGYHAVVDDDDWGYYRPGSRRRPVHPDYHYIPYDRDIITFLNQKVVAFQRRR